MLKVQCVGFKMCISLFLTIGVDSTTFWDIYISYIYTALYFVEDQFDNFTQ